MALYILVRPVHHETWTCGRTKDLLTHTAVAPNPLALTHRNLRFTRHPLSSQRLLGARLTGLAPDLLALITDTLPLVWLGGTECTDLCSGLADALRSEERRVGKDGGARCEARSSKEDG